MVEKRARRWLGRTPRVIYVHFSASLKKGPPVSVILGPYLFFSFLNFPAAVWDFEFSRGAVSVSSRLHALDFFYGHRKPFANRLP